MSYPINQKLNPNTQLTMGLNNAPNYPVSNETIQQNISTNPIIKAKEENPAFLIGAAIPIWLLLSKGMDKFNAACRNIVEKKPDGKIEYKENLIDKVRNFGDKISDSLGKTASGQSRSDKIFETISEKLKAVNNKFIKKVSVLDCLVNNPTKPESHMVKTVASGTLGELVQDAPDMFKHFASLGNGKYDVEKLKQLGFKSEADFVEWQEKFSKRNIHDNVKDVIARCKGEEGAKLGARLEDQVVDYAKSKEKSFLKRKLTGSMLSEETYDKTLGKVGKTLSRKIYFSEMANKLEALKGLNSTAGKTAAGRFLAKSFLRVAEGLTNATAGGKIAIAMQAFCFAQAIGRTIDAPKSEKIKTFMESAVHDLSFYLLMPLGIGLMHRAGGLKYIGLSSEQVAKYREGLADFNKKALAGTMSQEEHLKGVKQLKDMLKGDTKMSWKNDGGGKFALKGLKNIFHKPLKFVGRALTVGLERIAPLKTGKGGVAEFIKSLPYHIKGGAGYPVRFLAYMLAFAPPLAAAVVKAGPHTIFGRPTKSVLDDQKSEEKPLPPLVYPDDQAMQVAAQTADINTAQNMAQLAALQAVQQQNNLAYQNQNQNQNQNVAQRPMTTQNTTASRTMIPTEDKKGTSRRYIPSSDGVKRTAIDPAEAKAMAMLQKSMISEKIANKQIG